MCNRFHVLLKLCANIYVLPSELIEFLDKHSGKEVQFRTDLIVDTSTVVVIRDLQVGGLLGKTLTGSWMTNSFRKKGMQNLASTELLQCVVRKVSVLIESPILLWDRTFNRFGREQKDDPVHGKLCDSEPDQLSLSLARKSAQQFLTIIKRQTSRYLDLDLTLLKS